LKGLGVRPSSGTRLPGIEGLRAIAACSILVLHAWLYAPPGDQRTNLGRLDQFMPDLAFGVILFFTLSGFLLYRPFAGAVLRGSTPPSVRRYFRNRALRILPAYWVILLFCAIALGSVLFWSTSGNLADGRVLNSNHLARAALFLQDYSPSTILLGIGPAWSLAVEVVFYCALPLLAMLAVMLARGHTRSGRRWAALAPTALILAVGLSGKFAAAFLLPPTAPYEDWSQNWHSVLVRSFLCQADLFAFGMALAVLRVDFEDGLLRLPRWWRKAAVGGGLAAYLLAVIYGESHPAWHMSYALPNTIIAAACALLLALVVLPSQGADTSRLVRILETRPFVAVGLASYGIFLWHEPLIRWLHGHGLTFAGPGGFLLNLVLAAVVTGVLSAMTYRFVEAPALRLKFRRGRGLTEPVPAAQVEAAPPDLTLSRAHAP
jgi:peptidoglycan/LPS O-acetylase OafA/YrhL